MSAYWRRLRSRGCGTRGAVCARLGHRRLSPPAGGVLRRCRYQADIRERIALRACRVCVLARPNCPAGKRRARQRNYIKPNLGARPSGRDKHWLPARRQHINARQRRKRAQNSACARVLRLRDRQKRQNCVLAAAKGLKHGRKTRLCLNAGV